ncbi:hypothetical protein FDP41_008976 [Naegleria fowleri]|uniref:Uncharacterized protein n=1 Tax=Naegleria fowleri TaxID=5763 RepID=A0A6A5B3W6_NAEFO|nr:uncharacterized protein FDP41_008976 [Naegleria fowleri]KAF0972727.1 hypothetical protein FDP41_008976 [Naegleria fowleri]
MFDFVYSLWAGKYVSPQQIEPHKLTATGKEPWASAFVYPNNWRMNNASKRVLLKENRKWKLLVDVLMHSHAFLLSVLVLVLFIIISWFKMF